MDVSLQVLKEPRGFIRVIQCVMAILAFSTTAGFSTECEFFVDCKDDEKPVVTYDFGYPFSEPELSVPRSCDDTNMLEMELPFDFSNAAEFFVTTGVLSFLYTILILVVYIFFHQSYAQNNKLPVIDLIVTAVLSLFWLSGSSAWAQGVSDLKYYLHPDILVKIVPICILNEIHDCETVEDGSYGTLHASLILGFANFLLWICSLWFVYKETVFFLPETAPEANQNQQSKGVGKV